MGSGNERPNGMFCRRVYRGRNHAVFPPFTGFEFYRTLLIEFKPDLSTERLASHNLSLAHSAIINLFLSSMDDFARVNSVYASFFGTSPPSRACVALDLPPGIRARIDCLAFVENGNNINSERQALHVQSQSYWAPANIGPYSQAILVSGTWVFLRGLQHLSNTRS